MVVIALSKKHTKVSNDTKNRLINEVWSCAEENGMDWGFIMDSKTIQDSIDAISQRVATLSETVKLSKPPTKK